MCKRVLSLLLVLVMMVGMLPSVVLAQETAQVLQAVFASTVTANNDLSEIEWTATGEVAAATEGAPSASVSAAWNWTNLYLGVDDTDAESVTVALNDQPYTAKPVNGMAEFVMPWSALNCNLTDLSKNLEGLSVTLTGGEKTSAAVFDVVLTGMTANDVALTQMTKNGKTGNFTVAADSIVWETKEAGLAQVYISNQALVDHTKDILLTQTLCVESMPVSTGNVAKETQAGNGSYYFWVCDADDAKDGTAGDLSGSAVFCSVYADADGELYIRVHNNNRKTASKDREGVALGKSFEETFQLAVLWTTDDTVIVYVDGQEITVIEDATITNSGYLAPKSYRYGYAAGENDNAKITLTDPVLTVGDTSVRGLITQEALLGNIDLTNVQENLTLPENYGPYILTWESSDPGILSSTGIVTQGQTAQTVQLSCAVGATILWSTDVTVAASEAGMRFAVMGAETVALDNVMDELFWSGAVPVSGKTDDAPNGSVSMAYNRNGLYLGVKYSNATQLIAELNGKSKTVDLNSSGIQEIVLPWDEFDVVLDDYGQVIGGLKLTLKNGSGEAVLSDKACEIKLTSDRANVIALNSLTPNGNTADVTTYANTAVMKTSSTGTVRLYSSGLALVDHTRDITLSQDLYIKNMPVTNQGFQSGKGKNSYYFYLCYGTDSSTGPDIMLSVYRADEAGNLRLWVYDTNENFDLGKKLGDTFRLSVVWKAGTEAESYMDGAAEFYVNGTLIGTSDDATFQGNGQGKKTISLAYNNISAAAAELTVSNLTLTTGSVDSVLDEIKQRDVLSGVALNMIQSDIKLAETFESPFMGTIPLSWTSTNPAITNDGKVTQPADGESVTGTLTVSARGKVLYELNTTVVADPKESAEIVKPSPSIITTAFSASAITVDGTIDEEGWVLSTRVLNSESKIVGKFGVQWQTNKLYFAVKTGNAETLKLTLGEKVITVDLTNPTPDGDVTAIAKNGDYLELELSYTTPTKYNETVAVKVELDGCTYEGKLKLVSADWFVADNETRPLPANTKGSAKLGKDEKTDNQGYEQITGGWRMYDLYNDAGNNPAKIRTYVIFMNDAIYDPMDVRDRVIYTEFDFLAKSMPVYTVAEATGWASGAHQFASYGMCWFLSDSADSAKLSDSISLGIFNTADGLMLAALPSDGSTRTVLLNKQVGDLFRVATAWKPDGSTTIYIDGIALLTIENLETRRSSFGDDTIAFNLIRSTTPAASESDNMVVEITNVASGNSYGDSLLDMLTWDVIRQNNLEQNNVISDLKLPSELSNEQLTTPRTVTWSSNHAAIVIDGETGRVTRPENGAVTVTLTATMGEEIKNFTLRVMGKTAGSGDVLVLTDDFTPATGVGMVTEEYEFTLDGKNSSVIIDLKDEQPVNVVKLTDGDTFARLNEEVLTLWYSQDNASYTRIKDFKLKHDGANWYLFGFDAVDARYVKVHCTHFDGEEADFVAPTANMITAYLDDSLTVPQDGAVSVEVTTTLYDQAVEFALPDGMGATNLRVALNGELLYHYVDNGKVFVRVPNPGNTELTVWCSGAESIDLANKEYVYEVTYGTREVRNIGGTAHWLLKLEDGTLLTIGEISAQPYNKLYRAFSYDNGASWQDKEIIDCSVGFISEGGGFIYDTHTGRIMFQGHLVEKWVESDMTQSDAKTSIIYSDDQGKSWKQMGTVQTDASYLISYTDGTMLSCYDGVGPNVDFVFPAHSQYNNYGSFCCRVVYSTDAGLTWQTGKDKIIYTEGVSFEDGVSECTIQERDDGVLVLIGRNQGLGIDNFAQSYSYDHGITWTNPAKLSSVYSVNTQPIMFRYEDAVLLTWGGNNMLGGESRIRAPYNIGVTYDGMETFRNIQDLYVKYSLQGLTNATMNRITNQSVQVTDDDTLVTIWWNKAKGGTVNSTLMMRVEDFRDFLYRTKGAYDSFENGTVKYEGWEATGGDVLLSNEQKSGDNGSYSMKLVSATVARSVPYVQNGTVSMDIWVDGTSSFSVELQSAYTNVSGKGAPVGFKVDGYAVTFLGTEEASGLTLKEGWNTVVFELLLDAETPSATLSVNDSTAKTMPVNQQIGDYVSFVTIMNSGTVYVDNFLLVDAQDAEIYEQSAEGKVMQLIAAIGTVTLDSEERIATARAAYNALTEEQKAKVVNYDDLLAAEERLASLKELSIYSLEASVSLNDEVCYNFYFKLAEELTGTDVADMGLLVWESEPVDPTCGNDAKVYPGAVACTGEDAGKYKVSTDGVAAKNMGDAWYFRIYVKKTDGTYAYSKLFQYSAKTYAMNKIEENKDADLTKLCIALLNYGAEAQKYFKSEGTYDYTELMNAELTEEQKQIGYKDGMVAGLIQADESKIGVFKATEGGFEKKEASVSLGGALSINYYLTATNAATDMKLYVWDSETYGNAETLTAENATVIHMSNVSGNEFKGTVTGIVARQFDKTVYVCGEYEANGTVYRTGVIAYSFGKYCVNKAGQEVAERDVAMAAAVYGCYASQYLN